MSNLVEKPICWFSHAKAQVEVYLISFSCSVTEKVWESDSTDVSESEEPVAKVTKTTEPQKYKTSPAKVRELENEI